MDGPKGVGRGSLPHHHIVQFLSSASIPVPYLGAVPVDDLVDPGPEPVD